MTDTTEVATAIVRLITTGTAPCELLPLMARQFPNLTRAEFLVALRAATTAAERQGSIRH